MSADSAFERLLLEVVRLVEPIDLAVRDPARMTQLLEAIGWTLPPGVPELSLSGASFQRVVNGVSALAALTEAQRKDAGKVAALVADLALALSDFIASVDTAVGQLASGPGALAAPYLAATRIQERLVPRLLEHLTIAYLQRFHPMAHGILMVAGLIEYEEIEADPSSYRSRHTALRLRLDRIQSWSSGKTGWAQDVYGWGTANADMNKLLVNLSGLLVELGAEIRPFEISRADEEALLGRAVPEADQRKAMGVAIELLTADVSPVTLGLSIAELRPRRVGGADAGLGFAPWVLGTSELTFPLAGIDTLSLELRSSVRIQGIYVTLRPGEPPTLLIAGTTDVPAASGRVLAGLARADPAGTPVMLFDAPGGASLRARRLFAGAGVESSSNHPLGGVLVLEVEALELSVPLAGAGFVEHIAPVGELKASVDATLSYSQSSGLRFEGAAALEVALPIRQSLLDVIFVDAVRLRLALTKTGIEIHAGLDLDVSLGPLLLTIERLGARGALAFKRGNLGTVDLSVGFAAPTGIGVAIDSTTVTGGGYLSIDAASGRYSGVLALQAGSIGVSAIGLVETKNLPPDGRDGFSMLALINVRFPPIQLGFGFTLTGVGGLIGIHRTAKLEALQEQVRSGGLEQLLFARNPLKNARQIQAAASRVFPAANDRYVFAPIVEIGWGTPTLVTARVGVIIEVPAPLRLALVGQIEAVLPEASAAVVQLRMDVVGAVDFEKQWLSIDARLHDSRVALFEVAGDFALRLSWGARPNFVMSVGGFNPRFEAPPGFPTLKRLSVALTFEDWVSLALQAYLAITPNSLQLGARVDARLKLPLAFSVIGELGFDALIVFEPFGFVFDFFARVALLFHERVVLGIDLRGALAGPQPWHIQGTVKFTFIWEMKFPIDITIGDEPPARSLPTVNVWALLQKQLALPENWTGALDRRPADVTLVDRGAGLRIDPGADLVWQQKEIPLDMRLEKLGQHAVEGPTSFHVRSVLVGSSEISDPDAVQGHFAPGEFIALDDAAKLSVPAFEQMTSGLRAGLDGVQVGRSASIDCVMETFRIQAEPVNTERAVAVGRMSAALAGRLVQTGAVARSIPVEPSALPERQVQLLEDAYLVRSHREALLTRGASPLQSKRSALAAARRESSGSPGRSRFVCQPVWEVEP